ncbi:hypothetical protein KY327_01300 [Candidatus Woesearchaeota archaeon]|nr:hypothetical protein [Candidatus Woesearchaeota archaeon]
MEKKRSFSSSEEFAKSLEPHYNPQPSEEPATKMPGSPAQPGPAKPAQRTPKKPRPADPHAPRRRKRFETVSGVFLFLLLFFVMLLAVSTDSGPFLVLIGLLPSVFTVVFGLLLYEASIDNRKALWVVPIFLVVLFYWYGESGTGIFADLDVGVLSALNLIASFLFLIVTTFILQAPVKTPVKKVVRPVVRPRDEDLPSFIASIEDKGKALNFAIGRVYNAYHGGAKQLRDRIKIEQEWYDRFSHIPSDPSKVDFDALIVLIRKIESRLKLLEKTEAEVFGQAHKDFKNLIRDSAGKDRVIDVLDRNDKDPVKTYVEGALEFCGKVKDYARNRRAPGVENEYVGRDDGSGAPRSSSWSSSLEK